MKRHLTPLLALVLVTSFAHADQSATAQKTAPADLQSLSLNQPTASNYQDSGSTFSLDIPLSDTAQSDTDLGALYIKALKSQQTARWESFRRAERFARDEHQAVLAMADKFLAQQEQQDAEDNAMALRSLAAATDTVTESPSINEATVSLPLSSSATDAASFQSITGGNLDTSAMVETPEPATWALFGVGAGLLIFTVPGRSGRKNQKKEKKD